MNAFFIPHVTIAQKFMDCQLHEMNIPKDLHMPRFALDNFISISDFPDIHKASLLPFQSY